MIMNLTHQDSFLIWSANLLTGVDGSWLNVPDQYYGNSMNPSRPIGENSEIDQHLLGHVWWKEVNFCGKVLYQTDIYLVHDLDLLGDSMHLTMNALEI
ncbi:hypothetical protein Acr_00g0066610 [Actinidia rufa]|uniref:Uncharacterized protein n=1 Tax=Actinidia rufa TaxID=165716 RepID=A0A7J0DQ70_9ERIC|nr:hypothetical protein Acr_00g0066610 [Actinidia rufa]